MPDHENRGNADFSRYDAMTNEELEEILRLDAQKPEGEETDLEILLYVMEVLADRRRNSGHPGKSPQEAFESFKQNYYSFEEPDERSEPKAVKPRLPQWLRGVSAAAAIIAIVLFGSVTAKAFGVDIWAAVAQWSQETFHFGVGQQEETGEPGIDDRREYTSLQEVLDINKISEPLVPTWFPDGYALLDIFIEELPMTNTYLAVYLSGENLIKIQIKSYLNTDPQQVERSDALVETYDRGGTTYYIFDNNGFLQAAWINGSYECYISGDVTMEEMKAMIDSISKG